MEEMFDDVFRVWDRVVGTYKPFSNGIIPPYDEYLTDDGTLHFDIALAGYKKENISIELVDDGLSISVVGGDFPKLMSKCLHQGIRNSKFSMVVNLPISRYDVSKTEVSFVEGILSLKVPLFAEREKKKIEIK